MVPLTGVEPVELLGLSEATLPVCPQGRGGAGGRSRTDHMRGYGARALPLGFPGRVVAGLGVEPSLRAYETQTVCRTARIRVVDPVGVEPYWMSG